MVESELWGMFHSLDTYKGSPGVCRVSSAVSANCSLNVCTVSCKNMLDLVPCVVGNAVFYKVTLSSIIQLKVIINSRSYHSN